MGNQYNRFNRLIESINPGFNLYDFRNKEENLKIHIATTLNRTSRMFRYEGLPETIPQRSLELFLQCNGFAGIAERDGKLYAFFGGLGGEPDPYYMPTILTVANPALKFSQNYRIDEDCVVIRNDTMVQGLLPIIKRYASAMVETELSMNIANINSRVFSLISAPDDNTKESAEEFLRQVEEGRLGVVAESAFFDGVKSQPISTANRTLTDLIELEQYYKASLFNELGLNANYNMKRESLNSAESQLNNDALLPLVDDMLECRKIGIEKMNKMFGTNVTVSLDSAWEDNQQEINLEQESIGDDEKEVGADESLDKGDSD